MRLFVKMLAIMAVIFLSVESKSTTTYRKSTSTTSTTYTVPKTSSSKYSTGSSSYSSSPPKTTHTFYRTSYTAPTSTSYSSHSWSSSSGTHPLTGTGSTSYSTNRATTSDAGFTPSTTSSTAMSSGGFVHPSSRGSTRKHISSSTTTSTSNGIDGFVNPTTTSTTSTSSGGFVHPSSYGGTRKHTSTTTSTSSGSNGFATPPSTGSTVTSNNAYSEAGFVVPAAPPLPAAHSSTKYTSTSSSTTSHGDSDVDFITPSNGYTTSSLHTGTSNAGRMLSPISPPLPPVSNPGFVHPGATGKHTTTTTTTKTTNTMIPGSEAYNHGTYGTQAYSGGYGHSTQTNSAYTSSPTTIVHHVDKSKTKVKIPMVAPIFIPTSGVSYSNGHHTYYNTQYIYRESSSGHAGVDSAEEREMVGRITAAGGEGAKPIILYEHADHSGKGLILSVGKGQCVDLPSDFNDVTSSLNTFGNCFYLCEHEDCFGSCQKFAPGTGDQRFIGDLYNDHISSVKQC